MKKVLNFVIASIIFMSSVAAYSIDGDLSDWGVDIESAFSGNDQDWHPSKDSIDFVIEDNIDPTIPQRHPTVDPCDYTGYCEIGYHTVYEDPLPAGNGDFHVQPSGGEAYDIEAMYFDDDEEYGYFALVLSMGPNGYTDPWGVYDEPGDLAIDLDNDAQTGEFGYEYGIKLVGNMGLVCYNPDWEMGWDVPVQFECGSGSTSLGHAEVEFVDAGYDENGFPVFIVEGKVSRDYLGNPTNGEMSEMHSSVTCGNDPIEINEFDWDYNIPEFTTIGAGLVLLGAGLVTSRKRKR